MITEYLVYLKNNPQCYWFKRKLYGWGWTPARWQGWCTLALYVVAIAFFFKEIDAHSHSGSDTLIGLTLPFLLLTLVFIGICYMTGEPPRWQWGEDKKIHHYEK